MKFSIDKFKENIVQDRESGIVDPETLQGYLKEFYSQEDPCYPENPPYDITKIRAQAQMVCDTVTGFGMNKFQDLMDKFSSAPGNYGDANIMYDIKSAMESILYKMDTSGNPEALASQYNDHDFVCKEGTLTNLQSIVASLSLAKGDLNAYLVEQKISLLSAIAMDLRRQRTFNAPIYSRISILEVHHIPALVDSVADQYSLQKKANHDRWAPNISPMDTAILASSIETKLETEVVTSSFIDSVAASVLYNLPQFKEAENFQGDLTDHLKLLKLDEILNPYTLSIVDGDYKFLGYKPHAELIIKNGITQYVAQNGIIDCPDLELIKLKIAAENQVAMGGIDDDAMQEAKEKGCLNEFIKYLVKYKIPLQSEPDNPLATIQYGFSQAVDPTETHPVVWAFRQGFKIGTLDLVSDAILNDKRIDGHDPWKWMVQNLAPHEIKKLVQDNASHLTEQSALGMYEVASPENRNEVLSGMFRSYCELHQKDGSEGLKSNLETIYNKLVMIDNGSERPLGEGSELHRTLVKKANAFFKRLESDQRPVAMTLKGPEDSAPLKHLLDLPTLYLLTSKREEYSGTVIPLLRDKGVSEENFQKGLAELTELADKIARVPSSPTIVDETGSISTRSSADSAPPPPPFADRETVAAAPPPPPPPITIDDIMAGVTACLKTKYPKETITLKDDVKDKVSRTLSSVMDQINDGNKGNICMVIAKFLHPKSTLNSLIRRGELAKGVYTISGKTDLPTLAEAISTGDRALSFLNNNTSWPTKGMSF